MHLWFIHGVCEYMYITCDDMEMNDGKSNLLIYIYIHIYIYIVVGL